MKIPGQCNTHSDSPQFVLKKSQNCIMSVTHSKSSTASHHTWNKIPNPSMTCKKPATSSTYLFSLFPCLCPWKFLLHTPCILQCAVSGTLFPQLSERSHFASLHRPSLTTPVNVAASWQPLSCYPALFLLWPFSYLTLCYIFIYLFVYCLSPP